MMNSQQTRYRRPRQRHRATRLPEHIDALSLAAAQEHGRTIAEELRFASEAWGVLSALRTATAAGLPDVRRQASEDLRSVLADGLGAVPVVIAD